MLITLFALVILLIGIGIYAARKPPEQSPPLGMWVVTVNGGGSRYTDSFALLDEEVIEFATGNVSQRGIEDEAAAYAMFVMYYVEVQPGVDYEITVEMVLSENKTDPAVVLHSMTFKPTFDHGEPVGVELT